MQKTGNRISNVIDSALTSTPFNVEESGDVQKGTPEGNPFMFVPSTITTLESIPADVKNLIFTHAAMPVEFQQGLVALAKTSKNMRSAVREFMRKDENGKVFSTALKIGPAPYWQAQAKVLIQNAKIYRKEFLGSAASVCNNVSMRLSGEMATGALTRFKAIEFNLCKFDFNPAVSEQISSIRGKPLKINASGFKGELATLQSILQTALSAVDASCPVILDLSMNRMRDTDLHPLLAFMKIKPIIYQLNLDGNPLCTGNQASAVLPELFQLKTPLSHLYMKETGFNDATALAIRDALAEHPCLQHLDLRSNTLTEAGALPVIHAVGSERQDGVIHANTSLRGVRLQNNLFKNDVVLNDAVNQALCCWKKAMEGRPEFFDDTCAPIVQIEEITLFSANYFDEAALKNQHIANQAAEDQRL